MAKSIMIQGAGSNVGKSMLVAGLCRAFSNQGYRVAPFKSQNMSNNAAVSSDGGEIGRAQALQALACRLPSHTDMNPVLLKPETDTGSVVVVQGQVLTTSKARDYAELKPKLLPAVLESFERLKAKVDLVIVEGAGSPAEVNLREGDIANMGFASAANVPVILAGDIDRGGVIAQLVGTHHILSKSDCALIKGFLINKFRGDVSLFDGGLATIKAQTSWKSLGVLPWFSQAHKLPAEDSSDIGFAATGGKYKIAVPQLSRIANFDDLDPLALEPDVSVQMVPAGRPLPRDADLILIPGSKSTTGDLAFFRAQGWDIDLAAHIRHGGQVLGICGGFQMLGKTIIDKDGIEGQAGVHQGLGHLDVETHMISDKRVVEVQGRLLDQDIPVTGYEIHIGRTIGSDCTRAWLNIEGRKEGAASSNGQIKGCYIHGLFQSDAFRRHFLKSQGAGTSKLSYTTEVDAVLDLLAHHVEQNLDLPAVLEMMR